MDTDFKLILWGGFVFIIVAVIIRFRKTISLKLNFFGAKLESDPSSLKHIQRF